MQVEKEKRKLCPLQSRFALGAECLGEQCALYVKLKKITPDVYKAYTFEGCGLIKQIPWTCKKEGT